MSGWKRYRKLNAVEIRPYDEGENLKDVSVQPDYIPKSGDVIARDPKNPTDRWLISEEFFLANYEVIEVGIVE